MLEPVNFHRRPGSLPDDMAISPILTLDMIGASTELRQVNQRVFRHSGHMRWEDSDQYAHPAARIAFINALVDAVRQRFADRTRTLTFLSLGAGELLTEYWIALLLLNSGYRDIRWRMIDTVYANGRTNTGEADFFMRLRAMTRDSDRLIDTVSFSSEQAYLRHPLAQDDRQRGGLIVMACFPPIAEIPHNFVGYRRARGMRAGGGDHANCIYTLVRPPGSQQSLFPREQQLTRDVAVLDNAVRCSLAPGGGLRIETTGPGLVREVGRVQAGWIVAQRRAGAELTLRHLYMAVRVCGRQLRDRGCAMTHSYPFADYALALDNLRHHAQESPDSLYARFENNQTQLVGLPGGLPV